MSNIYFNFSSYKSTGLLVRMHARAYFLILFLKLLYIYNLSCRHFVLKNKSQTARSYIQSTEANWSDRFSMDLHIKFQKEGVLAVITAVITANTRYIFRASNYSRGRYSAMTSWRLLTCGWIIRTKREKVQGPGSTAFCSRHRTDAEPHRTRKVYNFKGRQRAVLYYSFTPRVFLPFVFALL